MKRFLSQLGTSENSVRKISRRRAAVAASVELLEPRRLLSAVAGVEQSLAQDAHRSLSVDPVRYDESSILVTFRPGVDPDSLADLLPAIDVGAGIDLVPGLREVRLGPGIGVERALEVFGQHRGVANAEPNYVIGFDATVTPDDPHYGSQWALPKIDAPTAWGVTTGSPGAIVAVADTGVDYNHPDLAPNIWRNPGEIAGDGIDNDGNGYIDDVRGWDFANNDANPMDDHGHGTHVAGTIAAVGNNGVGVAGVTWDTKVMPLKFLGSDGTGYVSHAVAALNYAVANGASISNHSWSTSSYSSTLETAVRNAANADHIVVAAAGNNGTDADTSPYYPAAFNLENVISVAATDSSDKLASFSNYGDTSVDLGAPGVSILSTTRGGGYGSMSGTSMAAPHVTGVVALVRGMHPLSSYSRIVDQVLSATDPVSSLQGKTVTGGRLNAAAALVSETPPLEKTAPPLASPSGTVVRVTTEAELQSAFSNLKSDTTIILAPGTYRLTKMLTIYGHKNVTIRGETGNRDDVVLVGPGMSNSSYGQAPSAIWSNSHNTLVADLTIRDFYFHGVILNAGAQAPRLYNLRIVDMGEQFVKSNPDGSGGGVNNGIVEYCRLEFTTTGRWYYSAGVDVHTGDGWIIRHNVFRNFRSPPGDQLMGPVIRIWNYSRNSVVDSNLFRNCEYGIAFGLDPYRTDDHYGGIIRNNFFHRAADESGDVGIVLNHSADTKVLHNTVILNGTYKNTIEYRFADTTGVEILYNLTDGPITRRDSASGTVAGNVTNAQPSWFVDPSAGDLHLTSAATAAIDRATAHASAAYDYDGQSRPIGAASDVGADEYGAAANRPPAAGDDTASTAPETAVTIDVLANDSDPDGHTLSISAVTQGTSGSVVINTSQGTLTYTPSAGFTGTDSFTYTIEDGHGGIDMATVSVQVSTAPPALNFNEYVLGSYGGSAQDVTGPVTIEDGGATLRIVGNRWKQIEFPYTITADTVLEFDFQSGAKGDIHGIGFDTDLELSPERAFQVDGTQAWGLENYQYTSSGGTQHFQIPVGQFYTGTFQYLFFAMDHDVSSPNGESVFSNVRIYEKTGNAAPMAQDDTASTTPETAVTIDVLANDSDPDGHALSVSAVTQGTGGSVVINTTEGTLTYAPNANFTGTDSFTYTVSDGNGGSDTATVTVEVSTAPPALNFNEYVLGSYAGSEQDVTGPVTIEDGGATLRIVGNRWKQIEFPYTVTAETVLEFDFQSGAKGDIHGIGFDTDLTLSPERAFQVYGTQPWGLENYQYTSAGGTQHFQIPVGQFYTGTFQYLFFAMDHDVSSPDGESVFSNVRIYEDSPALNFNDYVLGSYGGSEQDVTGPVTIEDSGATLRIVGNRWKQIEFPYTVTADTVLEFDFQSSAQGEVHGIGFDTDLTLSPERAFQVYGTQAWGLENYQYTSSGGTQHFQIPVGQFYTGTFQYLFFAMDHDVSSPDGESVFSNVRVHESTASGGAMAQSVSHPSDDELLPRDRLDALFSGFPELDGLS